MATLNEVLAQLQKENKILPDSFGNGITEIGLKEAIEKYGNCPTEFDGKYHVEIIAGVKLFDTLVGWASRKEVK